MPHGAQRAFAVIPVHAPRGGTHPAALRLHLARAAVAGALGLMLLVPAGVASAHDTDTDSEQQGVSTTFRPGALVSDHGVSVIAPRAGESVWSEIHFDDGSVQVLEVDTQTDGRVYVRYLGDDRPSRAPRPMWLQDEVREAQLSTTASTECSATSYNLYSWRMPSYKWYFQTGSTPSSLDRTETKGSILRANANIVTARNVCGRADYLGASYRYLGITSRGTNVTSSASCPGRDGYSVIGFGSLPSGIIGMTCVYGTSGGDASEADVRLNPSIRWSNSQSSCSSATLVESLMTHEMGHVYGLGHVSTSSLTMNSYVPNCSLAPASLGLGDMYGLERKY